MPRRRAARLASPPHSGARARGRRARRRRARAGAPPRRGPRRPRRGARQREVAAREPRGPREREGRLDRVLELAHVAGPVARQRAPRARRARSPATGESGRAVLVEEVLREQRHVLARARERRQREPHHVEAVVEVLPEAPRRDHLREVAVGRADHAHVHRHAPRCRRAGAPRASAARAAAWPARASGISPISSRKSVPPLASAEQPGRADRAGEGAALVPEQLALDDRLGQRAAVHRARRARRRGLEAWSARATSSLPVPLSPWISTVLSLWRRLASVRWSVRIARRRAHQRGLRLARHQLALELVVARD